MRASSHASNRRAADVPASALRDPARDVTPAGTPRCKNAGTHVREQGGKARNNPAVRTAAAQNLRAQTLGAGPRAAIPRQLTWLGARAAARDSAGPAAAAAHGPARWSGSAGSTASAATALLPRVSDAASTW